MSGYQFPPYHSLGALLDVNPPSVAAQLREENRQLRELIAALDAEPSLVGVVTGVKGNRCAVRLGPQFFDLAKPHGMDGIVPGASVRLRAGKPAILGVVESPAHGGVAAVSTVIDDERCEVEVGGQLRVVLYFCERPKAGDRVVLDDSYHVATINLGKARSAQTYYGRTGVSWDDIGGLVEAKRQMREAVEEPHLHKDVYKKFGRSQPRGILLHGPPGNGKTMLGKAAATALAELHGAGASQSGFIYVKGPELLNKYIGASEENVRRLFSEARIHKAEHGAPACVFIDEADAILGKRGEQRGVEGMERTLVPMFLAEMDGFDDAACVMLLATNRADALDPAVVREGRVDRKIHVGRPTRDDAADILERALEGRPLAQSSKRLAKAGADALYSPDLVLYHVHTRGGVERRMCLEHLVSGAMVVGAAELAAQLAIRRELDPAARRDKREGAKACPAERGIGPQDLQAAATRLCQEQRACNHADAIEEFVEPYANEVERVVRAPAQSP